MNTLHWQGALFDYLSNTVDEWATIGGAQVPRRLKDEQPPGAVFYADLSALPRFGVKGGEWNFLPKPPPVNGVVKTADGGLIARLGEDELLCLPNADGGGLPDVAAALMLPRRDGYFCFGLGGENAPDLLARLCMLPPPQEGSMQQTIIAAFDGLLIPAGNGKAFYWLGDAGYAAYAWYALTHIAPANAAPVGWEAWKNNL